MRNGTLDFLKFAFAVIIVNFHWVYDNGYLAVEFFFVVTGCMMAMSAEKRTMNLTLGEDTLQFIKHKLYGIIPNFVVAYIINIVVYVIVYDFDIIKTLYSIISCIPEFLLIHMASTGTNLFTCSYIYWYLSVMMISLLILYPLMRKYKDTFFNVISPVVFLFGIGYLLHEYGKLDCWFNWNGFMYAGIIRGGV